MTEGAGMNIRGIAAGLGAAGLLVAGVAGPAQAVQPVAKTTPYAQHFLSTTPDCGLDLHFESDVSGRSSIHPAPGSDEAFLFHDNYQFTETITLASDPDGCLRDHAGQRQLHRDQRHAAGSCRA